MPVIAVEYEDLARLLGRRIPTAELLDRLPMVGCHIEAERADGFDVEFFPNRPDLYSVEGVARALRGLWGTEAGLPTYPVRRSGVEFVVDPSVLDVRPHVEGALLRGVEMSDALVRSLIDLQEKLHVTLGRKRRKVSIGIHDVDRVQPPFTYKAVPPGSVRFVPLGGTEPMDLAEILERHPKGVEYAHILAGKDRYPLIVDARGTVLSFPPIINGVATTVTPDTRNLFLDVTGTDREGVRSSLAILCTSLAERGASLESVTMVTPSGREETPDLTPRRMEVEARALGDLVGLSLPPPEMVSLLRKMRLGVEARGDRLVVDVPAFRTDILHPVDLAEDLAIAVGYDRLEPQLPRHPTIGATSAAQDRAALVRHLLAGHGYLEVTTLTLGSHRSNEAVRVRNPVTEEQSALRSSLVPSLLQILQLNTHRDLPQRLFEVGDVVVQGRNEQRLGAVSCHARAGFTEAKSLVLGLARDLGVEAAVEARSDADYVRGRTAWIVAGGKRVGHFGEVHPRVLVAHDLGHPVAALEWSLGATLG